MEFLTNFWNNPPTTVMEGLDEAAKLRRAMDM